MPNSSKMRSKFSNEYIVLVAELGIEPSDFMVMSHVSRTVAPSPRHKF